MANGVKTYQIKIDGIDKSIDAVKSLEKELFNLEQKIAAVSKQAVSVKTSGGGYGGGSTKTSNVSSLTEEEKLEKQILQTEAKREAYSKEIYQNYLASKEALSETVKDQKSVAASERLQAKSYSNTIAGMKQEFADIKEVMQTVDLGDSDQIDKLTQRANELNDALAKIKTTYEQFGQNAGNYGDAFKDLQKVTLTVNGVEREFKNATVASRTLNKELEALQINGKGNTKQADELRKVINKLNSDIKDATVSSKAMDTAMDWMESFTAMASVGKGLKAFFGIDNTEITKSIQQLVALQGVLQGVEKIHKQIDSGEGIGEIFGKWFKNIDKYSNRLLAMNRAMLGTGTSAKIAAAGIKVLSGALKTIVSFGVYEVIELAQVAIGKLIGSLKDWVKGDADLISSTDAVNAAIDSQNRILEERLKLVQANMNANNITTEQARIETEKSYAKALEETNKRLKERAEILALQGINRNGNAEKRTSINLGGAIGDKGVTTIGGYDEAIKSIDDFIKRWDELEKTVSNDRGLNKLFNSASDARDELEHLAKIVGGDFINAINKFSDGTEKGARKLVDYINKMDKITSGRYSKAIQLVKVDNEGLQKELDEAWKLVQNLRDNIFKNPIIVKIELDTKIEQELDRLDPTRPMQRQLDEWKDLLKKGVNEAGDKLSVEEVANINKIIKEQDKALKKARRDRAKSERNDAKAIANETENYRKQLRELQIQNMEEGWAKEKAALEEELRQKLFIIKNNGVKVKQLELETRKLYNKKIQDAEADFKKREAQAYAETWEQIYRSTDERVRMHLDNELMQYETELKQYKEMATDFFRTEFSSYGGIQFNTSVKDSQKKRLGFGNSVENTNNGDIWLEGQKKKAKEYIKLADEVKTSFGGAFWVAEKALNDWLLANQTTEEEMEKLVDVQILRANDFNKSIDKIYNARINQVRLYYEKIEELEKLHADRSYENEIELLKNETNAAKREETSRYASQMSRLQENFNNGLISEQKYQEARVRITDEWSQNLITIGEKYDAESERLEQEHQDRLKEITAEGFRGRIQEFRDAYAAMSNIQARQPQTDKAGFGLVNISATRKNYKDALKAFEDLSKDVQKERENLDEAFNKLSEKDKQLFYDDYQQSKRELDQIGQDAVDAALETQKKLDNVIGEFIQSANQYFQFAMQGFQQIMQALWLAEDVAFDKEQDAINKENERLQKALDKNEEILQRHTNNVNDIEDELSSARGDRRQHLIDQLNAETEAQREAAQEKKRIEKEQEAQQRKQDALDKKRKEAQYKRDLANILISGALAAVNAYATKPFVPVGLAMGSLAIALTAAQYAIAKSAKPYAHGGQLDGGVADGPRHSQGGIKVLGGRAEIEGGEFITNRTSTAKNIDLLEYVNSQKRKVDINDLIDFYSSGKPKKVVQSIRGRFAEGGNLPTLRTDIDINDRLVSAFEDYAKTPSVVQVVDIIDRTKKVNNVKVLAGLSE